MSPRRESAVEAVHIFSDELVNAARGPLARMSRAVPADDLFYALLAAAVDFGNKMGANVGNAMACMLAAQVGSEEALALVSNVAAKLRGGARVVSAAEKAPAPVVCVAAIVTNPADEVLLVRNKRNAAPGYVGVGYVWELPGGRMRGSETWAEGVRREVREETGLDVVLATAPPDVLTGTPQPGAGFRSVILLARARAEGEPTAGDDALEARWWPVSELPELANLATSEALRAWATCAGIAVRSPISREERARLMRLVDLEPERDDLCFRCGNSIATEPELEPSTVCNGCAQALVHETLPRLLDALVVAERESASKTANTSEPLWNLRWHFPLPSAMVVIDDRYDEAGQRVYRVRLDATTASMGEAEGLAERFVAFAGQVRQ